MIIESLIRLGMPFVRGGLTPAESIKQVTDVTLPNARNFFQHIALAEIDAHPASAGDFGLAMHPLASWGAFIREGTGEDDKAGGKGSARPRRRPREQFIQDEARVVGIPIVLVSGGNPLARQGHYPVPSYAVYEGGPETTADSLRSMAGNPDNVMRFLQARASYTVAWVVREEELSALAEVIAAELPRPVAGAAKTMAVIVIVDYRGGAYSHERGIRGKPGFTADLGESLLYPGERIEAHLERILDNFWEAKFSEGEEKGKLLDGTCSFCAKRGVTVSSYAKGWPLFSTTYSYPLPQELEEEELVKSIAMCRDCYSALVFGANIFHKTEQTVDRAIAREIFSPTQSAIGKSTARVSRRTEDIYGSCYILPVLDGFLEDPEARQDFIHGNMKRLALRGSASALDLQLKNILGFETLLAGEISSESYRLTVIYYMGNWSRGAVDLVGTIQDVVPSVARALSEVCRGCGEFAAGVARELAVSWGSPISDEQEARYRARHGSLPYNLILAYGGSYVWQSLDSVLHRRPLPLEPFIRNVSRRMLDLAKDLSKVENSVRLRDEVVFYATFLKFLEVYQNEVIKEGGKIALGSWQSWTDNLRSSVPESWAPASLEEVGFAAGSIMRAFSRQYYYATDGKDFIKHRVMTFGSDLKPEDVWSRGVAKLGDYARRLGMAIPESLRQKAAAVSMSYLERREEVKRNRDSFMAAFWAGYELCPADLFPKREK